MIIIKDVIHTGDLLKRLKRREQGHVIKKGIVYEGTLLRNDIILIHFGLKDGRRDIPDSNFIMRINHGDMCELFDKKKIKANRSMKKAWKSWFYTIKTMVERSQEEHKKTFKDRAIPIIQLFMDNGVSEEF
jgi:hypothetical protein